MKLKLLAATALALATAATPANAGFTLSLGGLPGVVGLGANNYAADLTSSLGISIPDVLAYVDQGASLTIDQPGTITFYVLGADSGYINSFYVDGNLIGYEADQFWQDSDNPARLLGSVAYTGGPVNWGFKTNGTSDHGVDADLGQTGFGFFMSSAQTGNLTSDVLYLGYDDQGPSGWTGDDDNHDDFVIKAEFSPVPESATWAMLLSGFAVIGAAMRRRTSSLRRLQAV